MVERGRIVSQWCHMWRRDADVLLMKPVCGFFCVVRRSLDVVLVGIRYHVMCMLGAGLDVIGRSTGVLAVL